MKTLLYILGWSKKLTVIILAISLAASVTTLIPPKKAEAVDLVVVVGDAIQAIGNGIMLAMKSVSEFVIGGGITKLVAKEYALDPIVSSIAKMILRSMTQSVLAWAANGFQGNPAFIQDPKRFFGNMADRVIGNLIYSNEDLRWMCSPFQFQLRRALVMSRSFQQQSQCSLSGVINNFDGFVSGVNNELGTLGGWEAWSVMTTEPQNNPYGAFALLSVQAEAKITGSINREKDLTEWADGFLSWRDPSCVSAAQAVRYDRDNAREHELVGESAYESTANGIYTGRTILGEDGVSRPIERTTSGNESDCDVLTPGSVIANSINETLSLPGQELVAADEINEVIGAVLAGLLKQVLGGAGLSGAGRAYASNGESSYLAQFAAEDRQEFERTKAEHIAQVLGYATAENKYIAVKNQSLARLELSATTTRQVLKCEQGNTTTSNVLALIQSYIGAVKRDIAIGETNIVNTKKVTDAISATTYERRDNLSRILNQFTSLYGQLHHDGDVSNAEYERDFSIPERLEPIDAANASSLAQCQILSQTINTNSSNSSD